MYSFRVSNRTKFLHKIELISTSQSGKCIINSDWIPLVFRTDNVARQVGKLWATDANRGNDDHSLFIENQYVLSASKETIEVIMARWKEQNINIGKCILKKGRPSSTVIDSETKITILKMIRDGALA